MNNPTELIDRYIDMWNETDPARRRVLISRTWTESASYVDPLLAGEGHDGIDAMVAAVHQKYPGYRFHRTSEVDMHHDRARFNWTLGPKDGPPLVQGTDFAVIANSQKLANVTGFFDPATNRK